MTGKHQKKERRRHDRMPVEIPVEIASLSFKISNHDGQCRVVNISCSGLYCQIDRFFPVFTTLDVTFLLEPTPKNKDQKNKITCRGIVVRTEPSRLTKDCKEYRVAIFVPDGIPLDTLSGVIIN